MLKSEAQFRPSLRCAQAWVKNIPGWESVNSGFPNKRENSLFKKKDLCDNSIYVSLKRKRNRVAVVRMILLFFTIMWGTCFETVCLGAPLCILLSQLW